MRVLYLFSDFIYAVVYYVLGYRKEVVMQNLEIAFPNKSIEERRRVSKAFYRNLIDSFIETIKSVSASRAFLEKRVTANWEVLQPLFNSGKSCQLHLGHTFNWEWGHHALNRFTNYQVVVVYMPLSNKVLERLMRHLRTRYGNTFIAAGKMSSGMDEVKKTQYLLGLVADQSPGNLKNAYWLNFFGRPTAFVSGPEKGARSANLPVVFAHILKPRRGYYQACLEIACLNPLELKEGELTLLYGKYMEKIIQANPEMWLWSHRRWKHKWDEAYRENWIGGDVPRPVNTSILSNH